MKQGIRSGWLPVAAVGLVAGLGFGASSGWSSSLRAAFDDTPIKFEDCPKAVQQTILAQLKDGKIKEIEKADENGAITYEVEAVINGEVVEFIVASDGKFIGFEEDENGSKEGDEGEDSERVGSAVDLRGGCGTGPIEVPTPIDDGVSFSVVINHPYFPLSSVRYAELESGNTKMVREVQEKTKKISGVECLVMTEKEYENGELIEVSYNYFAQDEDGNVYYFGEDVDDYKDGKVVGHGGAWLVGKNADEPCLFMPARPRVGQEFKPENSPPDAEEFDLVEILDEDLAVPAGEFKDVLVIAEGDTRGVWKERKFYARGVGLISENKKLSLTTYKTR